MSSRPCEAHGQGEKQEAVHPTHTLFHSLIAFALALRLVGTAVSNTDCFQDKHCNRPLDRTRTDMRMALTRAFCLQCVTHLLFLDTRPAVQHRPETVKADRPLIRLQALHSSRKQIDAHIFGDAVTYSWKTPVRRKGKARRRDTSKGLAFVHG